MFDYQHPMVAAISAVEKTSQLDSRWAYGGGVASTAIARENAKLSVAALFVSGAEEVAVFPDIDGGVMITGYRGRESFEVLALPRGGFDVVFEDGDTTFPSLLLESVDGLLRALGDQRWHLNLTSVSFHRNILTSGSSGIIGSRSKIPPVGAFQSLMQNVPSQPQAQFALTSQHSIPGAFLDRQQRSGVLAQASFLQAHA